MLGLGSRALRHNRKTTAKKKKKIAVVEETIHPDRSSGNI